MYRRFRTANSNSSCRPCAHAGLCSPGHARARAPFPTAVCSYRGCAAGTCEQERRRPEGWEERPEGGDDKQREASGGRERGSAKRAGKKKRGSDAVQAARCPVAGRAKGKQKRASGLQQWRRAGGRLGEGRGAASGESASEKQRIRGWSAQGAGRTGWRESSAARGRGKRRRRRRRVRGRFSRSCGWCG